MISENVTGEARRPGRIEVVCGSMFSGKTEELIRRMRRAQFAKQRVEIFKPAIDTRYSEEDVVSPPSIHRQAFCCSPTTLMWWASTRRSSSTWDWSMCAMSWQTEASASSLPVLIWTSRAFPSVRCLPSVPSPTM